MEIDDLPSVLNPVQQADLCTILLLTPIEKRVNVALVWSGLPRGRWMELAGLTDDAQIPSAREVLLSRWLTGRSRFPLGAAHRLALILGLPMRVLFADQMVSEAARRLRAQETGPVAV